MSVIYLDNVERGKTLSTELERITGALKENQAVERIILFGSLAGGRVGINSDIDLLIVQDTDEPFLSRSMELMKCMNPTVAVDILVYTPEEFARAQKKSNPFIREILKRGKLIYEKPPC